MMQNTRSPTLAVALALALEAATILACTSAAACADSTSADDFDALVTTRDLVSEAPGFYFYPPLAPAPAPSGTLETAVLELTTASIVITGANGEDLDTVATFSHTGSPRLFVAPNQEFFSLVIVAADYFTDRTARYAVRVATGGLELGVADVPPQLFSFMDRFGPDFKIHLRFRPEHLSVDGDDDQIYDFRDNCRTIANADQLDTNEDGVGDACECAGVVCPPAQCYQTACNPTTGMCDYAVTADGLPCDDGSACTQTDFCSSGRCVGSNPIDCSGPILRILEPTPGAVVSGSVRVLLDIASEHALDTFELRVDGAIVAADRLRSRELFFDASAIARGAHILELRVRDETGATGADSLPIELASTGFRLDAVDPRSGESIANNRWLRLAVRYTDAGTGLARDDLTVEADLFELDNSFAGAPSSLSPLGDGWYLLERFIFPSNTLPDGEKPIRIAAWHPAAPFSVLSSTADIQLRNTPRIAFEIPGGFPVDDDPALSSGDVSTVTEVTLSGDQIGLRDDRAELVVRWTELADDPVDRLMISEEGASGHVAWLVRGEAAGGSTGVRTATISLNIPLGATPGVRSLNVRARTASGATSAPATHAIYVSGTRMCDCPGPNFLELEWTNPLCLAPIVYWSSSDLGSSVLAGQMASGDIAASLETAGPCLRCQTGTFSGRVELPNRMPEAYYFIDGFNNPCDHTNSFGQCASCLDGGVITRECSDICFFDRASYRYEICGRTYSNAMFETPAGPGRYDNFPIFCPGRPACPLISTLDASEELCRITLSGTVRYLDRGLFLEAAQTFKALTSGGEISVLRGSDGTVLARGELDAVGRYRLDITPTSIADRDVRLVVRAVRKLGTDPNAPEVRVVIPGGDCGEECTHQADMRVALSALPEQQVDFDIIDPVPAAAFNIFHTLVGAHLRTRLETDRVLRSIRAIWQPRYAPSCGGSCQDPGTNIIHISGTDKDPDEWDDGVIRHEFGHFVMQELSRLSGNAVGEHRCEDRVAPALAWSEGVANFWSAFIARKQGLKEPHFVYNRRQTTTDSINLEVSAVPGTAGNTIDGNISECLAGPIVWDFDDPMNANEGFEPFELSREVQRALFEELPRRTTDRGGSGVDLVDFIDAWRCIVQPMRPELDMQLMRYFAFAAVRFPYDYPGPDACR